MLIKEQTAKRKSLTAVLRYSFNKHQSINTYNENYAVFIYILILLDLLCRLLLS